jgi:xylan 1,4-beta-xylosidase
MKDMKRALHALALFALLAACSLHPTPSGGGRMPRPTTPSLVAAPSATAAPPTRLPPTEALTLTPTTLPSLAADIMLTLGAPEGGIRPLLGVNIGPLPQGDPGNADLTEAYHHIGVTMIRTHDYYGPLDMATLYPDQTADPANLASYDFAESDKIFNAILAGDFEPYVRLGDSYNAGPGFPAASPRAPRNRSNWVRAAVEVVRHYDALAAGKLRYVEIWNEPDNMQFWDAGRAEFFSLYVETARALKEEFPHLRVGGPGFTPAGALSPTGQAFTRAFLDFVQARSAPLDFFSWHLYSNDPHDVTNAARFYRAALDAHGFTAAESHVTEWNTEVKNFPDAATEQSIRLGGRGAAILTAQWIAMQNEGVAQAAFYRGPDPSMNAPSFYGLFYADGQPKRAALAFSLWAQLAAHPERLSLTFDSDSGLWVIAGRNTAGEIAVLIANPTDTAHVWQLNNPAGQIAVQEVSDASETISVASLAAGTYPLNAYSVQLLIVK